MSPILFEIVDSSTPPQDWAERHRPRSIPEIVGNEDKIRRVRFWLDQWSSREIPKKKGLLLSGPPGVGKTTLAHALAEERGWAIVELNASEQRNAAAIRSSATRGSQHISLDQFAKRSESPIRTVILLDEVDHLGGSFAKVSEERIEKTLGSSDEGALLKGDSGGKAELLNLLKVSRQPVIMTCNDPMRLWGRGGNWRSNRDRVLRVAESVIFDRVNRGDLRKIALRILDSEGVGIDPGSLESLIDGNPGDLRALVRDLQSLSITSDGHIEMSSVNSLSEAAIRDSQVNVFRALRRAYVEKSGSSAAEVLRNSDKDPEEMLAWFAWNNLSIMSSTGLSEVSPTMSRSDSYLSAKFFNRAFRSWYWGTALQAYAAVAYSPKTSEDEVFVSFPDFLRRGGETWRISDLVGKISTSLGMSKSSVREDLLPILLAIHDPQLGGAEYEFSVSKRIGLEAEDHLAIYGIPRASKKGKEIFEAFNDGNDVIENVSIEVRERKDEDKGAQSRLDSFG